MKFFTCVFCVCLMTIQSMAGVIAHWRFEEGGGYTVTSETNSYGITYTGNLQRATTFTDNVPVPTIGGEANNYSLGGNLRGGDPSGGAWGEVIFPDQTMTLGSSFTYECYFLTITHMPSTFFTIQDDVNKLDIGMALSGGGFGYRIYVKEE